MTLIYLLKPPVATADSVDGLHAFLVIAGSARGIFVAADVEVVNFKYVCLAGTRVLEYCHRTIDLDRTRDRALHVVFAIFDGTLRSTCFRDGKLAFLSLFLFDDLD